MRNIVLFFHFKLTILPEKKLNGGAEAPAERC